MAEKEKEKEKPQVTETKSLQTSSPLIFISHDSRDAELAEAFSKLLKSISVGMLKSFRSSDKKGTEGIEYGDDWYKRLMSHLDSASDVVCLFTERSLARPWILYEAGVAKGKLDKPVLGIALGVPLGEVGSGPFYQFQNCDDDEDSLIGLVTQLSKRIPGAEPDEDVVRTQVQTFKATADEILSKLAKPGTETKKETPSADATAKQLEELKVMFREMPSLLEDLLSDNAGDSRSRKRRRFNPMMLKEMMHMDEMGRGQPIMILVFASLIRDDAPWLYEIAMEAFRALTSGTQKSVEQIRLSIKLLRNFPMRSHMFEELMMDSKESHMLTMEGPPILERMIRRCLDERKRS
ncbi:toll/interleukin-1 receptor domain-containing protein [Candidatus Pacearchaeota archaeon]|nr:toll/interleukin-1 receptor domain-containing protein [Candidatus Pacearchaeota archaeon]